MKLEDQVCSLENAKRLKELGVEQESYFYWLNIYLDNWVLFHAENDDCNQHSAPGDITFLKMKMKANQAVSAFTSAELCELLPIMFNGTPLQILRGADIRNILPMYCARYWDAGLIGSSDANMANACAKMLIHLLENKLI